MVQPPESYQTQLSRLFAGDPRFTEKSIRSITFQVTEDCTLRCSYCYQPVKYHTYMTFDIAKQMIDLLFSLAKQKDSIVSYDEVGGVVFDFIGGEPFLAIDLINEIVEYIERKMLEENSPWLLFHKYSFSSNGTLYFEPKVQEFIKKYSDLLSVSITVDGSKELHDSCRLFPDGTGSYDIAIKAALYHKAHYGGYDTKITLSPYNIDKLYQAVRNMWSLGYTYVNANCCFEEGWTAEHARIFYYELKKLADFIIDNELWDTYGTALFQEDSFKPYGEDNQNWCGGTGLMLSVDYKGLIYPCIRYMPSSLNGEQPPLVIGDVLGGLYNTEERQETKSLLDSITRTSQSTEECNQCPIGIGCAWCSGYNYQKFGTPNKRATFICVMHKARALGNLYFWSKYYDKTGECNRVFKNYVTDAIALEILPKDEYLNLLNLYRRIDNG